MMRVSLPAILSLLAIARRPVFGDSVIISSAPVTIPAPRVSYYVPPAPVIISPVTTSYYVPPAPVTYSAPVTTYYSPPVTTYYSPPVTTYYAAPVTTYYAPAVTSYYAQPVVVDSPGVAVSSYRYGLLGRRVYTSSYYAPIPVVVPAYGTAVRYYGPVYP